MKRRTIQFPEVGVKCVVQRQHRRRERPVEQEHGGPRIFSDVYFMNIDEGSAGMLVVMFRSSGRIAATALRSKGVT